VPGVRSESPTAGDVAYVAYVGMRNSGFLKKQFAYTTSVSRTPVKCHVTASWNAQKAGSPSETSDLLCGPGFDVGGGGG